MESGPSFSLRLTQTQSTFNEIDISGSVPGNFDYKDVGLCENRSKYRNDLTIMKKLWDTASVKGNKTVVAISKEISKEVVKTDPLRKDFFIEKQLYRLGGMPHVLNVWMYEYCSEVDKDIACRIDNRIPRICNWFVVGTKPKFEKFMNGMFSKKKTDTERRESVTDQEKIKDQPSVEEVNESPSGISNTITEPINEEAPYEPSLMDFGEWTPPVKRNPPIFESGCKSTQKINMSGGTYPEQVLMKVDMNAIESLVKKYVVIEIDSSNKDVEKNETHGDDLGTPKEHPKDVPEKCNTICGAFTERKLPDLILPTNNIEDRNELQVSCTVISSEVFQEFIDNNIVGMSTPIDAMPINSNNLLQKVNLPDPSLRMGNVEVSNELRESTNDSSTDASQESIDNIIAGTSTPFVAMKMKSVSPTAINDNECQIHDTQFQSILPEAKMGKQHAIKTCAPRIRKRTTIFRSPFTTEFGLICKGKESTIIDFPRKHPFDSYLISHDMPTRLIEEYCDWIAEGLLKFHEKK
ncbi:hypothetical protein BC332_31697 [Capsicum chinense]|nr:hypothetical protein BC332_31697 [Capsicum chinense]